MISAAPLLVKDLIVVGGTGGDAAHRGSLTAFHAKTGRFAWRFYITPAPGRAWQRNLGRGFMEIWRRRSLDDRVV